MIKRSFLLIIFPVLFFASCSNYYIPLESFKTQLAGIDSSKMKDVAVKGPGFTTLHYKANPIAVIYCIDQHNKPFQMVNSPSVEAKITYGYKHERAVFYFDKIYLSHNLMVGGQSRFLETLNKSILLDSITKIEVQDKHKKFDYVNK